MLDPAIKARRVLIRGRKLIERGVQAEYFAWINMFHRVYNPSHKQYHNYGGRGITIHENWFDFEVFLKDMGPRPASTSRRDEWSLDRIDNNKGYSKSNCKWSQRAEQMHNRTIVTNQVSIQPLTYQGQTKTIGEWARQFNQKPHNLWLRLRAGWTVEKAITQPPSHSNRYGRKKTKATL